MSEWPVPGCPGSWSPPFIRAGASGVISAAKAVVILSERARSELTEIRVTDGQYPAAPEDWVAYFGRTWLSGSGAVPAAIDLNRPGDGEVVIEVADTSLGHVVLLNDTPTLVAGRDYRA